MARICYIEKSFIPSHVEVIRKANALIDNYERRGLSLRAEAAQTR